MAADRTPQLPTTPEAVRQLRAAHPLATVAVQIVHWGDEPHTAVARATVTLPSGASHAALGMALASQVTLYAEEAANRALHAAIDGLALDQAPRERGGHSPSDDTSPEENDDPDDPGAAIPLINASAIELATWLNAATSMTALAQARQKVQAAISAGELTETDRDHLTTVYKDRKNALQVPRAQADVPF